MAMKGKLKPKEGTKMKPLIHFKKILILPLLIALALVAPEVARANAVTDWNAIASTAIVPTAGQAPQAAALSFGMVQGAVYDAVNAIDNGHQPYLAQPPSNPTDSKEAATAAAAFRVRGGLSRPSRPVPSTAPDTATAVQWYIAGLPDNPPGLRAAGVTIGEATARAMLERG